MSNHTLHANLLRAGRLESAVIVSPAQSQMLLQLITTLGDNTYDP